MLMPIYFDFTANADVMRGIPNNFYFHLNKILSKHLLLAEVCLFDMETDYL